ncbi:MAG: DUF4199 family protein [Saprospiraceae bacterium]|nr:DUF4199 family protein [Saprospiraceae bacterium]
MKNVSVRYGLLGGMVVVFFFVMLYIVKKDYLLNIWLYWGSLVFYLLFMWQAAKEDCAEKGVARDFRDIIRTPFTVFLLVNLLFWLCWYTLHLADPELLRMETQLQLDYLQKQLDAGPGDPQRANQLREQIQTIEKEGVSLTMGTVFMQMGIGALGGFLLAAGIAGIMRARK